LHCLSVSHQKDYVSSSQCFAVYLPMMPFFKFAPSIALSPVGFVRPHIDLDDYEISFVTDTNSTISGIPGPGRTVDALLNKAGWRLDKAIHKYRNRGEIRNRAERDSFGNNSAKHGRTKRVARLTENTHKMHIRLASTFHSAWQQRYTTSEGHYQPLLHKLLAKAWNGTCNECKRSFIGHGPHSQLDRDELCIQGL
jgi:hypothetical protein